MKSVALKSAILTYGVFCLMAIAGTCRAQTEAKTFGKFTDGTNSVTVKANRTAQVSHGAKTWKRQLEIIVYRPYDSASYYSDEHYSDQDAVNLRKALAAMTARYQQWKGKRLGTQMLGFEIRKPDDNRGIKAIAVDLQMDEMGKIAIVFSQGDVAVESSAANLAKFRDLVNNASAWLAADPGAAVGGKKAAR